MLGKKVSCKYAGPWSDFTGYGEANRNTIRALVEAGVEVTTERVVYSASKKGFGKSFEIAKKLEGRSMPYDIKIVHVPSDGYLKFLEPCKYHIGHLFWETDGLSKTWAWNCNLMDEIWTGGEFHKQSFIKSGVKVPIHVFPQALSTNIDAQRPFNVPHHEGYLFYSIFQWIERKNPRALLKAYWEEFQGVTDVTLLLKVYRFGFDKKEKDVIRDDIKRWKRKSGLTSFPRVLLCFDFLSKEDVLRLHSTGDCFVSAHRGEGWGVPQAEAASVGNPVISTNIGGVHEWFEDGHTAHLVGWEKTGVFNMGFAPWYSKDQNWAEVNIDELKRKMRRVFNNSGDGGRIGTNAKKMVKDKLSYKAVGNLMKKRLEEIQKTI